MHTLVTSRRERTIKQRKKKKKKQKKKTKKKKKKKQRKSNNELALFVSFFTTLYDDACLPPEAKNSLHTQGRQFSALNSAMEQLRLVDKRA
ncbi:hypothetical protein T4B_3047 [Trichinella pseudospiralis]|uniref:Uncharacterized protein n=1 Tax=Trichinella pseudospiralis TaxID=6337 RepID=A0A0V1IZM8_TRIPS|nr:hypothetical protein T4A_11529 [Trichinella pseudospiralis]KRZ28191.1 hypothetical protein T4B_3047 [Trichinella pseudospiralis]KRZ37960.1 hypothetical protein T4C_10657 [Trichinella pseudospiralis]